MARRLRPSLTSLSRSVHKTPAEHNMGSKPVNSSQPFSRECVCAPADCIVEPVSQLARCVHCPLTRLLLGAGPGHEGGC